VRLLEIAPCSQSAAAHCIALAPLGRGRNAQPSSESAARAIQTLRTDIVPFGRPYIAHPDLVARFRLNAPLNTPDAPTHPSGGDRGLSDYPPLQHALAEIA
jgi:2,4-dienoyl-CoA reductase-like NADH-dependent reductase (Old Yellow Enzyme family)